MPQIFVGWLVPILRFVIQIVLPLVWTGYLLKKILAHSVCLSGQRTSSENDGAATYRFALQNNEEVSLSSHQKLVIEIVDAGGQFKDDPVVYAGCTKIRAGCEDTRRKVWTMTFDELPAYDTWAIVCNMNREARNVRVTLQEGDSFIPGAFLSHDKLLLTSDRSSVFAGHRTTPEKWWAIIATVLAVAAYLARALDFKFNFDLSTLTAFDWWALTGIVIFAAILYLAIRRSSPPITQGYWQPTHCEPLATVAASPQPVAEQSGGAVAK